MSFYAVAPTAQPPLTPVGHALPYRESGAPGVSSSSFAHHHSSGVGMYEAREEATTKRGAAAAAGEGTTNDIAGDGLPFSFVACPPFRHPHSAPSPLYRRPTVCSVKSPPPRTALPQRSPLLEVAQRELSVANERFYEFLSHFAASQQPVEILPMDASASPRQATETRALPNPVRRTGSAATSAGAPARSTSPSPPVHVLPSCRTGHTLGWPWDLHQKFLAALLRVGRRRRRHPTEGTTHHFYSSTRIGGLHDHSEGEEEEEEEEDLPSCHRRPSRYMDPHDPEAEPGGGGLSGFPLRRMVPGQNSSSSRPMRGGGRERRRGTSSLSTAWTLEQSGDWVHGIPLEELSSMVWEELTRRGRRTPVASSPALGLPSAVFSMAAASPLSLLTPGEVQAHVQHYLRYLRLVSEKKRCEEAFRLAAAHFQSQRARAVQREEDRLCRRVQAVALAKESRRRAYFEAQKRKLEAWRRETPTEVHREDGGSKHEGVKAKKLQTKAMETPRGGPSPRATAPPLGFPPPSTQKARKKVPTAEAEGTEAEGKGDVPPNGASRLPPAAEEAARRDRQAAQEAVALALARRGRAALQAGRERYRRVVAHQDQVEAQKKVAVQARVWRHLAAQQQRWEEAAAVAAGEGCGSPTKPRLARDSCASPPMGLSFSSPHYADPTSSAAHRWALTAHPELESEEAMQLLRLFDEVDVGGVATCSSSSSLLVPPSPITHVAHRRKQRHARHHHAAGSTQRSPRPRPSALEEVERGGEGAPGQTPPFQGQRGPPLPRTPAAPPTAPVPEGLPTTRQRGSSTPTSTSLAAAAAHREEERRRSSRGPVPGATATLYTSAALPRYADPTSSAVHRWATTAYPTLPVEEVHAFLESMQRHQLQRAEAVEGGGAPEPSEAPRGGDFLRGGDERAEGAGFLASLDAENENAAVRRMLFGAPVVDV